jgi:hypothetical protein
MSNVELAVFQAMRDAGTVGVVAGNNSVSTEDSFVSDGGHELGIELSDINRGEEDEEGGDDVTKEEDLLVSYKDSEKLVTQDSPGGGWTRALYSDSSKCCKTKASIVISKGMFLLVGVAVLVAGAVLAGTIRHHPTDDDQCYNSSLMSTALSNVVLTPTRTSDRSNPLIHSVITPSPVKRTTNSGGMTTHLHLLPSPISDIHNNEPHTCVNC